MDGRGPCTALALSLALLTAVPTAAQPSGADRIGPVPRDPAAAPAPPQALEFRVVPGDLRRPGDPRRSGLIAAYPVADNVEIGLGRFRILEIAGPRAHMDNDRSIAAARARDRSIAAIGVSLRF